MNSNKNDFRSHLPHLTKCRQYLSGGVNFVCLFVFIVAALGPHCSRAPLQMQRSGFSLRGLLIVAHGL